MPIPDRWSPMKHELLGSVDGILRVGRAMIGSPRMQAGPRFADVITACASVS